MKSNILPASSITQMDLLFDVDNSTSLGDKQPFLAQAIPNLVGRLIQPNCVSASGGAEYASTVGESGPSCNAGDSLEFAPITDLHLAVVTSSLGKRGGDICDPASPNYGPRTDNQAHLVGNGTQGITVTFADETPSSFLAWFPGWAGGDAGTAPLETSASTLVRDFGDVITDTGADGCGIESQLESWYRFLIQPDPYTEIDVNNGIATWGDGVDSTILSERAAFLRPHSIVGIVVLTDENDSEVDARSYGGFGYSFMMETGNGVLCQAPAICATDPNSPSGVFAQDANGDCANGAYTALDSWGFNANLRHVHTREKYALNPQYPVARYVKGLTSATIPDRDEEYPPGSEAPYAGLTNATCENPLFAASLYAPTSPTISYASSKQALCNPAQEANVLRRTPNMVFYMIIGGVPYQDLHYPTPDSNGVTDWSGYSLSSADWTWIVGKDPEVYDYSGIDPHMIEDYQPRQHASFGMTAKAGTAPPAADVAGGASASLAPPTATLTSAWDPINGREWITDGVDPSGVPIHNPNGLAVDRQYACIFPIQPRDCTVPANTAVGCDCQAADGSLTHDQRSPLCDDNHPQSQIFGKAYPTTRELLVARDLGAVAGANPGVVASICPALVDPSKPNDPMYGYDLLQEWLARNDNRKSISVAFEFSVLRQFCIFRRREDPSVFVPERNWTRQPTASGSFLPYVLTAANVKTLLRLAGSLQRPPFRAPLCRTLLLVLYCTGIRFGEALRLRLCDVDLKAAVLFVAESKGRSRWVPFHVSLVRDMERYLVARKAFVGATNGDRFFVGFNKSRLPVSTAHGTLCALFRRAGLKPESGRIGPRPYDLRHTFAVHRLERWYRAGVDIHARLPWLSAYMGHDNILGTETYLTATPRLLAIAARRMKRRLSIRGGRRS